MSGSYSRLPNPTSNIHDPERELADAFELNDEDDKNDHPIDSVDINNRHQFRQTQTSTTVQVNDGYSSIPPAYDFERLDYDFPPPGSPPKPTPRALPNHWGNSNGLIPDTPDIPQRPQQSLFRRTLGSLFPSRYQALPTSESSRPVGGGTDNDGVFANVTAKPQASRTEQASDGSIYVVPEDAQKETPPTYAEAQADAVPPYWETTVLAPASMDPNADMIIDDMATGSFIVFALNLIFSFFFQFVGFFLTYLLHTTHAAKYGSRAGLGLTLIQYGFYSRMAIEEESSRDDHNYAYWGHITPGANATATTENPANDPQQMANSSTTSKDWLSFLFMTLGWFLLLSSCVGFWRVKRWESSLRAPPAEPTQPEDVERDEAVRRNIALIFGFPQQQANDPVRQQAAIAAELRLQRDLQAAGLL
ncbi:hypothetical protein FA15DRAFT_666693 [Coprinopsis marcescibilis]|uniref:Metal homeostatis protein bsd2 n=1 Tax=Coprinopsis marcescibilis TaxID=230819 RepID=A0A5C3LFC0_COPMA|nr:hypothetical protein FA15DRAFT_666693 [Coprinopsis marcescibilis]